MHSQSNSPVARLIELLEDVAKQDLATDVKTVWSRVFGVPPSELSTLLRLFANVLLLSNEARAAVVAALGSDGTELHTPSFDQLDRALAATNFEGGSRTLVTEVRAALGGLRYSADLVRRLTPAETFDTGVLQEMSKMIGELTDCLLEADLPKSVKALLLLRIDAVQTAINEIRLHGAEGVTMALDALVGAAVRAETDIKANPSLTDRLTKLMDLGYKLVTVAEKFRQLADPVMKVLGAG